MQANPYQNMIYNPQQTSYQPQQFGYNPYQMQQRYQPQQMQEQMQMQMQPQLPRGLNGKVVQSVEMITANDVPMDGSVALFPMQDMSVILAKSWNADGTIKTILYRPQVESTTSDGNKVVDTENLKLGLSDEVTAVFMQRFDELSSRLEQIEQSFAKPAVKSSTNKKEG